MSVKINNFWTNHWNAGFTLVPNAKNSNGDKATTFGYNFGTSFIYNWKDKSNFLCEFVMNGNEVTSGPETKSMDNSYLVVPGFRTAFQAGSDTEIVPGIGLILGVGPSAVNHERGIFAYLSIESKLW